MSLVPDYKGLRNLISRTSSMVRDFLLEEVYHDSDPEELAGSWGTTVQQVLNLTGDGEMDIMDLLHLLDFSELDFGITIRDPGSGKEVTFFAAQNLGGSEEEEMELISEEVINYGSRGKTHDGIDFIPQVHRIDGKYNLEEEEQHPRNPFETEADLDEEEEECENCGDHARLPDSLLCHYCLEAGVEASPPDHLLPEIDGVEIMASIRAEAERTRQKSLSLLERAGMLLGEESDLEEEEEEEEETYTSKGPRGEDEEEEGGDYFRMGQAEDKYSPDVKEFFRFDEEE